MERSQSVGQSQILTAPAASILRAGASYALPWRMLALASACMVYSCGSEAPGSLPSTSPAGNGGQTVGGSPSAEGAAGNAAAGRSGGEGGSGVAAATGHSGGKRAVDAGASLVSTPDAAAPAGCTIIPNGGSLTDDDVNVDLGVELQRISGFGGMDGGFYPELTAAQVDTAFGNGPGQLGLSIMRIRIPETPDRFNVSVAAAARAVQLGARVMATPWSPPVSMKSNGSTVGGSLNVESYGAYADHLLAFRDFMQANGLPLHALSPRTFTTRWRRASALTSGGPFAAATG